MQRSKLAERWRSWPAGPFLAYTGPRWGEAAALRLRNVDLPRRRIQVVASVTKTATMTLDLYGHLFPDRTDDLADRMDSAACAPDVPQNDDGDGNAPETPR